MQATELTERVVTALGGILGGGAGVKFLGVLQARRASSDQAAHDITVRITDEAANLRHELWTENKDLRERLLVEIERRHVAELEREQLRGIKMELERRVVSLGERFDTVVRLSAAPAPDLPAVAT